MVEWAVDLYSDTKTRPSAAMRGAMMAADVGDEQQDEDPTVTALNARIAALLGTEDTVFLPTGTMANLCAVLVHCNRGDEILAAKRWVANRYGFSEGAARVIFSPPTPQDQLADPRLSPDGSRVAVISGLMSDFGSTGGDILVVPTSGGAAINVTAGARASTIAIDWRCGGQLAARLLAGDETRLVRLDARPSTVPAVLGAGQQSLSGTRGPLASTCDSKTTVVVREDFNRPPEIAVGRIGRWHA